MSNSALSTYTRLTKNHTVLKNKKNILIIPHCIVGQWTARYGADYFATTKRQCSANYVIGKDGDISTSVEEKNRAWTSGGTDKSGKAIRVNGVSGADADCMGVTIEIASDTTHPYAITDAAWNALVRLCVDICKRNGIPELKWKANKSLVGHWDEQNIVVHRWFANKACPGDYIYNRLGELAASVNAQLGKPITQKPTPAPSTGKSYLVKVNVDNLNIRTGPGTNYPSVGKTGKGIFTIVEEARGQVNHRGTMGTWGKLKSGAGWICVSLGYTQKL